MPPIETLQPWSAQIVNLSEQTSAVFHNDSGTQKCPAIYIFTEQTQVARLSQLSQIAKSKLCYKRIVIKKILSRDLVGSDNHFIGTRCLSKSLELIVKPTQLFLLQIHFEIAFKRHWKRLGTGAPPIWEGVTPLNSANTVTVSSLSFSPTVHPKFRTYTSFWQEGFVYEWFWQILEKSISLDHVEQEMIAVWWLSEISFVMLLHNWSEQRCDHHRCTNTFKELKEVLPSSHRALHAIQR